MSPTIIAWISEITALIASFLSLAALIVVLVVYDGQPIFSWHGVTLNAIVSVFATASKASLLLAIEDLISQWKWILFTSQSRPLIDFEHIDLASRGPYGSLLVMLKYVSGNSSLVTVNADLPMQSAVLYGLSQPLDRVIQQTSWSCTSTQCAWPAYESLAVCSLCSDVTSRLTRLRSSGQLWVSLDPTNPADEIGPTGGTAFILPNGLVLDNGNGWVYGQHFISNDIAGAILMSTFGTGNGSETVTMQNVDTLIWSMSMIQVEGDPKNSSAAWPTLPVSATECALMYCVRSYQDQVINGSYVQLSTPVANAGRVPQSWQPSDSLIFGNTTLDPRILSSLDFSSYNSIIRRTDLSLFSPETGIAYNLSQAAIDTISAYLGSTFATDLVLFSTYTNGTNNGRLNGYYLDSNNPSSRLFGPSVFQELFTNDDINSTFAAIAASMTVALKDGADAEFNGNSSTFPGQKLVTTVVYSIRWPWITLNLLLVTTAPILLVVTLRNDSGLKRPADSWKSSTLAVMSRGPVVQHILAGTQDVKEMKRRAEGTNVSLLSRAFKITRMELDPLPCDDEEIEMIPPGTASP
ncbi:hypothetical protein F5Y16DRAFT_418906 [Xylariaceae sp. FL0255]|nr:hypothetical protein F5Y16DRAFT_418906 [Xylariaceae sp. FL0255]